MVRAIKAGYFVVLLGIVNAAAGSAQAPKVDSRSRDEALIMLHTVDGEIRKQYYDPTLHGAEFEKRMTQAEQEIRNATSLNQAYAMIGWAVAGLNDSHTIFLAPGRISIIDYGWRMQMIGDECYITHVRPGSDASAQGLKPGDQILSINGLPLLRSDFHKVELMLYELAPQPELKLKVRPWHGEEHELRVLAKVKTMPERIDLSDSSGYYRIVLRQMYDLDQNPRIDCKEMGQALAICRIPGFEFEEDDIQRMINFARRHRSLILDLRGNPGGSTATLKYLVGGIFDHPVKIASVFGRKPGTQEMIARPLRQVFSGNLAVLVDSSSASASELFARVVQLEKRGKVLGDRSAGLVMQATLNVYKIGVDPVLFYGLMITNANLIMADGTSLEHQGVVPDEQIMPGPGDLAAGDDPVLSRAAALMDVNLSAEAAGKLFPFAWSDR